MKFVMHVVGFDVTDEDQTQLACIAEAGGGKYFGAADAARLLAALQAVRARKSRKRSSRPRPRWSSRRRAWASSGSSCRARYRACRDSASSARSATRW